MVDDDSFSFSYKWVWALIVDLLNGLLLFFLLWPNKSECAMCNVSLRCMAGTCALFLKDYTTTLINQHNTQCVQEFYNKETSLQL